MEKTEYVVYVDGYATKERFRTSNIEEARRVYDALRDCNLVLEKHPRMQLRKITTKIEQEILINGIV